MTPVTALQRPLTEDLSGFVRLLRTLQIPHRVTESAGRQIVLVPNQAFADQVIALYQQYPQGNDELTAPQRQAPTRAGFFSQLKHTPLVVVVLLMTFAVAAITQLGGNLPTVSWFSFTDFHIEGDYLYLGYLEQTLGEGQWWRLITPMLLHFGWLHLAMNTLWYWELGRRIEQFQGLWALLLLTLLFSLVSNVAQYAYAGPSLFGGLSGVLYGLLGHCWLYQRLAPNPVYRLPSGVVAMMLIWLVVCMTGIFETLGIGAIANAAHVGGLVTGCITGIVGGWLARVRRARP